MAGIIILVILVPLAIIILLISLLIRNGEQQRLLESLFDSIKELKSEIKNLNKGVVHKEQAPLTSTPIIKDEQTKPIESLPLKPAPKVEELPKTTEWYTLPDPEPARTFKLPIAEKEKKESRFSKNTDWEKFIGENLASKIGITILVLGIAFFVKYAIDKNWINEFGRVIIGLLSGAILIGLAHYFRNSYRSFSSVLVGGGLTVFYFSIAFAFHQYHLIGQTSAFVIMVIISGLGVCLSLFYNRQELAILATIGGFITPFLVSTGQENYIALFTYLCILNSGLMVLAWFKRWPSINIIGLFFTTIIFGGWLIKKIIIDDGDTFPFRDALLFATLFYTLFVIMNIINTLRLKEKFRAFDFLVLLSTNFLYYAAGMTILSSWSEGKYKGLFTLLLGIVNILLAASFWRKKSADRNFVALLTGLGLTFISLSSPIELDGNYVVLFWAAEAIILYTLYVRTKYELLRMSAFVISTCMMVALLIVWSDIYFNNNGALLPVIFHKGFITTVIAGGSLLTIYRMGKGELPSTRKTLLVLAIIIIYAAGAFEIEYQISSRFQPESLYNTYLQLYTNLFVIIVFQLFRKAGFYATLKLLGTIGCFAFYLWSVSTTVEVSEWLFLNNKGNLFFGHWVSILLMTWMIYDLIIHYFKQSDTRWMTRRELFTWIASGSIVLFLSVEMYQVMFWTNYRNGLDWTEWENLYYKAGLSMLWGLCSFGMMWLGMKRGYRPIRIVSLTLFSITILKLFLIDIRNIPPGGKIIAFILLGILLLAVSFMYQRLKKLILDNGGE
jgi:uncharacterized membrane protein